MEKVVSIAVATYNSAAFIIETLESIYRQTYEHLALVVSDDASHDNTLVKVNEWIVQDKVKNRFQSIEVITVSQNTGVSANCNRCIAAVPSDWLKFIAGDDILLSNCIEDNVNFVQENPKANIIFSQVKLYQDVFQENHYIKTTPQDYPANLMSDSLNASAQYNLLLVSDRIHYTPSFFCNKKALLAVGGYDETNRLVEDYPMWLKLTKAGERLYYFHKVTVGYRIHAKATNNKSEDVIFKPSLFNAFVIRKRIAHPYLPFEIVASEYHSYLVSKFFHKMGWNKKSKITSTAYRISCFYLNPFYYLYSFKKRMSNYKSNYFYH